MNLGFFALVRFVPWPSTNLNMETFNAVFPLPHGERSVYQGKNPMADLLAEQAITLIGRHLRPFLEAWLGKHGLSVEGVRSWAVHPGGPRILTAVEEALGLRPDALAASYAVLGRYGNMSSPTLLFILDEMMRGGAERPCVALGFGPGLTVEAALWG